MAAFGTRVPCEVFIVPSIITGPTLSYLWQSVYQQTSGVLRRLAYQHTGSPQRGFFSGRTAGRA